MDGSSCKNGEFYLGITKVYAQLAIAVLLQNEIINIHDRYIYCQDFNSWKLE